MSQSCIKFSLGITLYLFCHVAIINVLGNEPIGMEGVNGATAAGPYLKETATHQPVGMERHKWGLNHPFFVIQHAMTWMEAVSACEEQRSHLAVLPKKEHAEELVEDLFGRSDKANLLDNAKPKTYEMGISRRYWIGLTDHIEEKKWMWTGLGVELDYDFWYPGQPSHGKGHDVPAKIEHCGSLWNPGYYAAERNKHSFNDAPCTKKYYPICDTTEDLKSWLKEAKP